MNTFTYPTSALDDSRKLLSLLGSHWGATYQGYELVRDHCYARAQTDAQTYLGYLEAIASVSRFTVPIFHTDNWYFLPILETEFLEDPLTYGDGSVYGPQPSNNVEYKFGGNHGSTYYNVSVPDGLERVRTIFNRITEPSVTLTEGLDYIISNDSLVFAANLFDNDLIPKRDIYEDGEVVDRQIGLWLFKGQFDWEHTYKHFGYVLGMHLTPSSESYRDLVNAVMDALVEGTAEKHIEAVVAAVAGIPVVIEATEVVEAIITDHRGLLIATDQNAYRYSDASTAIVAVGDTVVAGQQLVDSVEFFDLNQGATPAINAVTLDEGFLLSDYYGEITFYNKTVPLVVDTTEAKTKVSFELGGWPASVQQFWDDTHTRGVASGNTLANMLDVRDNPTTEPDATNLPATINPLEFLVENLLRFNAYVVRIKVAATDATLGFENLRFLRRITPPWTTVIVLLELTADDDSILLDGAGSATDAGYTEAMVTFDGMEPVEESIDGSVSITESVQLTQVEGFCV
jgi:hypothetical protein